MNELPRMVGEELISRRGPVRVVRRYYAGWHPHLGRLHFGWSGKETVVETTVVPIRTFVVQPATAVDTAPRTGHAGG